MSALGRRLMRLFGDISVLTYCMFTYLLRTPYQLLDACLRRKTELCKPI